jgi:hypothetical protein
MTLYLRIYIVGGDSKQPIAKSGKGSGGGRKYYPGIGLEGLRKSMELFRHSSIRLHGVVHH